MEPTELDAFAQRIVNDPNTNWPRDTYAVQLVKLIVHVMKEVDVMKKEQERIAEGHRHSWAR